MATRKTTKKKKPATTKVSVQPRERLAPSVKPELELPVKVSTKKPIGPESLRPKTWIRRTVR